jgi:DNA recombination protein RmuC
MIINIVLLALVVAAILLILVLGMSVRRNSERIQDLQRDQKENPALSLMQQQIGQLTGQVDQRLRGLSDQFLKTTGTIDQQIQGMSAQFRDTTGHIGDNLSNVSSHLTKVEEVTKQVLEKSKDIAALEDLLRAPKFRGGLGEFFLGDLLAQILPPAHFTTQYPFRSGEKVDAVIKLGNNLVPIDAKFPLENFKKYIQEEPGKEKDNLRKKFISDIKKHIDSIATKYILPDEGTYDFALMYIPAENIYYETILKDENIGDDKSVFSYAMQKRVIPVSPNSFFAYLQVIVLGLKGLQIEKSAQEIFRTLSQLEGDLGRFKTDFEVLGTHLVNARAKYEEADKRLDKVADRLELMQGDMGGKLPEGEGQPSH